jgi:predicted RNase H-like nuclease (RuvC/YqgF family)
MLNSWLAELQVAVDTLREDKKELQTRVTELEETIAMYKSMVERLRLAMGQGSDYYL